MVRVGTFITQIILDDRPQWLAGANVPVEDFAHDRVMYQCGEEFGESGMEPTYAIAEYAKVSFSRKLEISINSNGPLKVGLSFHGEKFTESKDCPFPKQERVVIGATPPKDIEGKGNIIITTEHTVSGFIILIPYD